MPENLTDRKCCHKCNKTGNKKLSKCARCHSITYCGQECQRADWPRHREFCIPVMVAEIPNRGIGLVASKNFKMGELIFEEKAIISVSAPEGRHVATLGMAFALKDQIKTLSEEQASKFYKLTPKEGYFNPTRMEIGRRADCIQELMIMYSYASYNIFNDRLTLLLNSAFVNHSCKPNTIMFATHEPESKVEIRAIEDISKGDEITHSIITNTNFVSQFDMRQKLLGTYHLNCNCPVCSGKISNQDDIRSEIGSIINSLPQLIYKQSQIPHIFMDWRVNVSRLERAIDLLKQLYIGDVFSRCQTLVDIAVAAQLAREPVLLEKALTTHKEQVSAWGLDGRFDDFEDLMKEVERWSEEIKSGRRPTKEEVDCFCKFSSDDD